MLAELPIVGVAVAAALYALGGRGGPVGRRERSERRWRTPLFAAGLVTIVVATAGPMDRLADRLFSVHMAQHVLLLEVAAPLVVLSRPWSRLWRPFPLSARRTVARGVAQRRWAMPVRVTGRFLAVPAVALVVMNGVLVLWHVPPLYDGALAHPAVHAVQHATFFLAALVLWSHLLAGGPIRARLTLPARAFYAVGCMLVGWALAVVIATAPAPLYSHYADLATRPLGLSPLVDQQLAAGVMWVPGSVPWVVVALVCAYGWLDPDTRRHGRLRQVAGEH